MGFGAYFFPLVIIFSGTIFILNKFDFKEKRVILAALLIFLSFFIFLDGIIPANYTLLDRIKNAINLSKISKGGGNYRKLLWLIFSTRLFGSIGTYIVLSFVIMFVLLLITNKNLAWLIKKITEPMKKIIRKTSKPNISTPTPVDDIKEDINVVEYSKNLGRPTLKEVNHKGGNRKYT